MKNQNGYTIIEMLTVTALFGILLVACIQIFEMHLDYYLMQYERIVLQNKVKNLYIDLSEEIQHASSIQVGCSGHCLDVDSIHYEIKDGALYKDDVRIMDVLVKDAPFQDCGTGCVKAAFLTVYEDADYKFDFVAHKRVDDL